MEHQSQTSSMNTSDQFIRTTSSHYDKSNLSRRSVDWRDSGIVIDEEQHQFNSFDALFDYNQSTSSISSVQQMPNASSPFNTPSATSDCCPVQRIAYQDDDGDTVLHLAVVGCHLNKVRDLIKICDLNSINNMMQTPLHVAVLANRPEMVELLMASGARLDVHDRRGNTPLHLACQKGHEGIVDMILGNDNLVPDKRKYIELTNFDGQTCLHLASTNDQRKIIKLLVDRYNANINCRDSKSGETIMHKAISKFNVELVAFILALQKHCNLSDYSGREPLDTIKILRESRLTNDQLELLNKIHFLVTERINACIDSGEDCCRRSKHSNQTDKDDILDSSGSSSSSDYSDSDYEMN